MADDLAAPVAADPTAWDLAMDAIEDHGCDCDSAPESLADHTCLAGRCEYAMVTERAQREKAERERDEARAMLVEVATLTGEREPTWGLALIGMERMIGEHDDRCALMEAEVARLHIASTDAASWLDVDPCAPDLARGRCEAHGGQRLPCPHGEARRILRDRILSAIATEPDPEPGTEADIATDAALPVRGTTTTDRED